MTNQEFSDAFSTLLNSYNTQAAFGDQASQREIVLDEYEKSVLLTQAQDIIVKSYFEGSTGQGFDDSIRRQVDFSSLIKVSDLSPTEGSSSYKAFDTRGIVYDLPKVLGGTNTEVLYILNEKLIETKYISIGEQEVTETKEYVVVPINYREYDREMSKPYAQPLKKQAWRLFQNMTSGFDVKSEIIPKFNIILTSDPNHPEEGESTLIFRIRYVKRPSPIVLEDLPSGLSIDGKSDESPCELNPILHMDILAKAVELAVATRGVAPAKNNRQEQ